MSGSSPSSRIANRKETCEYDVDEWIVALLAPSLWIDESVARVKRPQLIRNE